MSIAPNLVFISGASSGIGLALAKAVPFEARVIDISRSGAPGFDHFEADLADPNSWASVGALFEREMSVFSGERVIFVHSAGTLLPIGFAGEVDEKGYAAQVLLNSAAPQVLGDAFLRSASRCKAQCQLLMIGSGAASSVYRGWSAYCGGKAAVDHWVRTVGAELRHRGSATRVASVAPGVVATAECIDPKHAVLFEGMENVSLVFPLQLANNLLVQESQDPGVSLLTQVITSNQMEGTLLSIRLESVPDKQVPYPHVAKHMLDRDINLLGIVRNGTVHLRFVDLFPIVDDVLVYIGSSRLEWATVQESMVS